MNPSDSLDIFETSFLPAAGLDGASMAALAVAVCSFYERRRVEGAGADGDMLLFQFGTWDWGSGDRFQVDLTRQFIIPGDSDDDDVMSRFALTRYFDPSAELAKLGSAEKWCHAPADAASFTAWVCGHPVMEEAERATRIGTETRWEHI
jgi:hypothetical protein